MANAANTAGILKHDPVLKKLRAEYRNYAYQPYAGAQRAELTRRMADRIR